MITTGLSEVFVATVTSLADRLRTELGDMGKSFVYQEIASGETNRYQLPYSPLDGLNLIVNVDAVDVSTDVEVEETTGYLTFDDIPEAGAAIVVAGTYYRYFTNAEIEQYINNALAQHTLNKSDSLGRPITVANLPVVEEYPLVILATIQALYTLATDASFDIDIQAPDGVMIPRSERYRQLSNEINARQAQYRELCSLLGIGMYSVDVFSLRRVSKTTNRYVPVYLPMEVDDRAMPKRALLSIPSYGSKQRPSDVPTQDLNLYEGDSYEVTLDFPFDVTDYTFKADISGANMASPVKLTSFNITVHPTDNTKLILSLTSAQTSILPDRCYWDIQATSAPDPDYQKTYIKGMLFVDRQVTV
jgi:hypothetical protein